MPRGAFFIRPARVTVIYGEALSDSEAEQLRTESDDKALAEMMRRKVAELYDCHTSKPAANQTLQSNAD